MHYCVSKIQRTSPPLVYRKAVVVLFLNLR